MHGTQQSLIMTIVAITFAAITILFGLAVYSENHQQLTANNAVRVALMDARDDSGRVARGPFVLNTKRFENDLNNSNVAHWRSSNDKYNNTKDSQTSLAYYYLQDDSAGAQQFRELTKDTGSNKDLQAIKAVKVVVTQNRKVKASTAYQDLKKDQKLPNPVLGVARINGNKPGEDITQKVLDREITGDTLVYETRPIDVVTYVVNQRVHRNADDMYRYQVPDDYNKQLHGKDPTKEQQKDRKYTDNNDIHNYGDKNSHTDSDKQYKE